MTERKVSIGIDIIGQSQLEDLQAVIADLTSKVANVAVNVQTKGLEHISRSQGEIRKTTGLLSQIGSVASEASNKASSAFGMVQKTIEDTGTSVTKLIGAISMIGVGGAVGGLSWLGAEQVKLYTDEVYNAIDANKKLGVSHELLQATVAKIVAETPGYKTESEVTQELYSAMAMGSKYLGKGEKGLTNAEAISKFFYANQEMLAKEGITDIDALIQRAIRTPGKMEGRFGAAFQAATGLTDKEMHSAKTRMKAMMEKGGKVEIGVEVAKRPWEAVATNIDSLKRKIGDAMGSTLMPLTQKIADWVTQISEIPAAPGLIGMAGIAIAAAGGLSLLIGVMSPLAGLIWAIVNSSTVAAIATKAWAAAQWLLNAAMSANPLGIAILALAALAGILYLIEQRTHIFSKAFGELGKTAMVKDLVNWFKDLGKYIDQGIKGLDKLYKGGGFKAVLDVATSTAMPLLKPTLMIVDFLYRLWTKSDALNKLINAGMGLWQKMAGFLDWLSSMFNAFYAWVQNAIPGAQKAKYGEEINRALGVTEKTPYGKKNITYEDGEFYQWSNKWYLEEGKQGTTYWGKTKISDEEAARSFSQKVINKAELERQAPGFAEGIAKAVKDGLSTLDDIIGQAIKDNMPKIEIPGMENLGKVLGDLNTVLTNLNTWLEQHGVGTSITGVGSEGFGATGGMGGTGSTSPGKGKTGGGARAESTQEQDSEEQGLENPWIGAAKFAVVGPGSMFLQEGGTITGSGMAFVHAGERVEPAKAVVGGESLLDRINRGMAGTPPGAGGTTNINAHVTVNVNVARMDNNTDVRRLASQIGHQAGAELLFSLRGGLDGIAQRNIASLRG